MSRIDDLATLNEQHRWNFIFSYSNGLTTDQMDYCEKCGVLRKSYFHKGGGYINPSYFGVGVEFGAIEQPICYPKWQAPDQRPDAVTISDAMIERGAKAIGACRIMRMNSNEEMASAALEAALAPETNDGN